MSKHYSKFTRDLRRLNQRIQASKEALRQTEIKTEDLGASIHAARIAYDIRLHKRLK